MMRIGPFQVPLTDILLKMVSQHIAADIWTNQCLLPFVGKVVQLEIGTVCIVLKIQVSNHQVYLQALAKDDLTTADALLKIQANDLSKLMNANERMSAIHIQGDAALIQVLAELVKYQSFEWQAGLQKLFGPLVTYQIEKFLSVSLDTCKMLLLRLSENVLWYAKQERLLIPTQNEHQQLAQAIGTANHKLIDIERQIAQLQERTLRMTR